MWHSSNTNLMQYFNIWSMGSCEIYLNILNFCSEEFVMLRNMLQCNARSAQSIAVWSSLKLRCPFKLFVFRETVQASSDML
eukprot:7313568-Ditylum_brightwellii.AAC.1